MSTITKNDLILQCSKEGRRVDQYKDNRFSDHGYCEWLEEKLLDKMNTEKELEEIFIEGSFGE